MRIAVLVFSMLLAGVAQALPLFRYVAVSLVIDGVEYNYSRTVEETGVLYSGSAFEYINETPTNGISVVVRNSGGGVFVKCGSSEVDTWSDFTTWNIGSLGPASNVVLTRSGYAFSRVVNQTSATIEFRPNTLSSLAQTLPPGIGTTTNAHYRFSWLVTSGSSQGIKLYSLSSGAVVSSAPDMLYGFLVGEFAFRRAPKMDETRLLYGSANVPIFGEGGALLYSDPPDNQYTNAVVMTEWAFDQDAYGSPVAYINGENVCGAHSTGHIIDYPVASAEDWTYNWDTLKFESTFTMSISVQSGKPGGSCNFRCWVDKEATYDMSDEDQRASIYGNHTTVAGFKIIYDPRTGRVTLTVNN